MSTKFLTTCLTLAAAYLSTSYAQLEPAKDTLSPPGLVLVEGGRTKIGTSYKDIVKLMEEHHEAREKAGGFLSEVPQHTVSVDDFFMMVTEVTNEQYREFVLAAGAQPPVLWADKVVAEARSLYIEEQAKKRERLKAEGKKQEKRLKFVAADWWKQNWKGNEWEMPEVLAKKPVVFIDYQDARAYSRWAGLRLPTEFEFERAVRDDTDNNFTWGKEWKPDLAVTKEMRSTIDILDVGSFPGGANEFGVFDLVGNVWEWTSSKYVPYPDWKHKKFTLGKGSLKRTIDLMPKWSPDRRVVRGGSKVTDKVYARASTRGGFDRDMIGSVLGFRCAASVKPGYDFSVNSMRDIPNDIRVEDAKGPVLYDPTQVIARDRWISNDGSSDTPNYGIITQYDYILFTPVKSLQTNGLGDMRKGTLEDEVYHIGFLATNQDLVEPALHAGTYLIAIRGSGKYPDRTKEPEGEDAPEPVEAGAPTDKGDEEKQGQSTLRVDEFLEIDPLVDNYIFIDMSGEPVAAMPATQLDYGNPKAGMGGARTVDRDVMIEVSANDPDDPEATEQIEVTQQWLDVSYFIKGRSRKGVKAVLSLRFAEGLLNGSWR